MALANRANRNVPIPDLPTIDEKAEETGADFKLALKEKIQKLH
jgi:hypothetical protein